MTASDLRRRAVEGESSGGGDSSLRRFEVVLGVGGESVRLTADDTVEFVAAALTRLVERRVATILPRGGGRKGDIRILDHKWSDFFSLKK